MYSEVPFHTQDQCSAFRDFVISHTEPASRVFSGSSFGSAFSFSNTLEDEVGKRFIVWRVQDNKLELIDLCFEQELQHNSIRIYFPHHIIPTVSIVEYTSSSNDFVCVLVFTAGRILYRFIFPHPLTLLRNPATRSHSIFESTTARDIDASNTLVPLTLRRTSDPPVMCGASSPTHFSVACGSLIFLIRLTEPRITHFSARPGKLEATETEYPEHGLIASYLPLIRRSQPPVLGLAMLDNYADSDDPLVFALSASKLHVYSKRVNVIYPLSSDTITEGVVVSGGMLRVASNMVGEDGNQVMNLRVVIARFREEGDHVEVLTFVGKHEKGTSFTLEQSSCQLLDSSCIIDFAIGLPDKDNTWVLGCNKENEYTVFNSVTHKFDQEDESVSGPDEEDFEQVTMSKKKTRTWSVSPLLQKSPMLPEVEPNTIDVDSFYWDILHRHGQFDKQTIANALTLLDPPRDKELRAPLHKLPYSRLQSAAHAIVRKVIEEESDEEQYDPVRHAANVWGRVWAHCVKQWEAANTPIGLHIDMETGLYLVIRQSTVGLFRSRFPLEMVAWTEDEEGEERSEARFLQDEDVDNLWTCCNYVLDELGPASLIRFDCDLAVNQTEIHQLGAIYTESVMGSQSEESSFATNFIKYFYVIKDPVAAADRLFEMINQQSTVDEDSVKVEFRNACALASAAGGVVELADARYRVSTGLFLALSVVSRLRTSLHTPPPALAQLTARVYDTAARMVRLHSALSWLVTQPFDRPNQRWMPVENQFTNLSLGQGTPPSLVEGYIRASNFVVPPSEVHDASHVVSQIGLQVCASLDINTASAHPFMDFVVRNEQWSALEKLVQRLEGIQPVPFEYGRGVVLEAQLLQDLKGCALLNMGKYDNASDVLANVASYIAEDEGIAVRVIGETYINEGLASLPSQRGQDLCPVALKWFYCLKVASMFAAHRQFQHAERFFTVALPHTDDPHAHRSPDHIRNEVAAVAWSSIFDARLNMDPPQFEQAYQALTAYPDFPRSERSQDALRHLVTQLCDSGKEGVAALHKLPFVGKGVVSTVISHILHKARHSELPSDLSNPLNYYTVLYSFLIIRDNFREAAKTMYEYAQRIPSSHQSRDSSSPSSHSSPQDKLRAQQNPYLFQAQAYLIAINSLKIVDPNYQWISVETQDKSQQSKRKRNDNIPTPTIPITVTLYDIEKAYTLASAHSFLWTTASKNPKQGLIMRGSGPNVQDTYSMLVIAENYKLALELAQKFFMDPKLVLDNLTEKCGRDPKFAVATGWKLLQDWLDANDVVSSIEDISPSRMREIVRERNNQNAGNRNEEEGDELSFSGTVYRVVGNYVDKIEVRDEPGSDPRYYARLADTRGTVDICVKSPLPSSINFGQPVLIISTLRPEGKIDANKMDESAHAHARVRPQETLHALQVVALRQNAPHGYHELIADKLLATNPRIVLPVWLVQWFSKSNNFYSELLRIYLIHNRLEDATFVAIDMLEAAVQQLKHARGGPTQIFLPYTLLDNLFSALEDGQPAKSRLNHELRSYFSLLDQPAR